MFANLKEKLNKLSVTAKTSGRVLGIFWDWNPLLFVGDLVSIVVPSTLIFINAYIYKIIIDLVVRAYQTGTFDFRYFWILVAIRLLSMLIQNLSYAAQTYFDKIIWTSFPSRLEVMALAKISSLDLEQFEKPELQDRLERIRYSIQWRPLNLITNSFLMFQGFVQVVIALIAIASLNWILMLFVLLATIPSFIVSTQYAATVWSIYHDKSPYHKKNWYIATMLQSPERIKEVKIFGLRKKFLEDLKEIFLLFEGEYGGVAKKQFTKDGLMKALNALIDVVVEVYVLFAAIGRKISIGSVSYYSTVLYQFENAIGGLFMNASNVYEASLYMKDVFDVMDEKEKITSPANAIKLDIHKAPRIEFRNISFAYPGSDKLIFKNFSLTIEPGQKIALVGENGAGKTTLMKLLARFYDVNEGEILIDGRNIKELDLEEWYKSIGMLFQDYIHYNYPLKDNIYFGKAFESENIEEIKAAAELSGADKVAESLPKGYDQMLGKLFEGGEDLSAGQWQKIALARAFLRNAPVLILDEPTASIDAKAEAEIFERVEHLSNDKTVIIISHRFSTVKNADLIYVLEGGKIIESGSHKELMKQRDGVYHDLFTLQARAYQDQDRT